MENETYTIRGAEAGRSLAHEVNDLHNLMAALDDIAYATVFSDDLRAQAQHDLEEASQRFSAVNIEINTDTDRDANLAYHELIATLSADW